MCWLDLIISDYKKYKNYGSNIFVIFFLTQGFWASFQYRIAHAIFIKVKNNIIRKILLIPILFWQKIIEICTGISIPWSVNIGHSLYIGHYGTVIINSNAIIGNNCNISQGVTIGVSGQGEKRGTPVIGDNVYLGANSVVIGKINIGNNVLIAASSLVNRDIPDYSVVLGVPAQIISNKGSAGYI